MSLLPRLEPRRQLPSAAAIAATEALIAGLVRQPLEHQHNPILPPLTVVGAGPALPRAPRGALPAPFEIAAGNRARAVASDGAATIAVLERTIAKVVRAARAELAQVPR